MLVFWGNTKYFLVVNHFFEEIKRSEKSHKMTPFRTSYVVITVLNALKITSLPEQSRKTFFFLRLKQKFFVLFFSCGGRKGW